MSDWADYLEEDLKWREAELASLKRITIVNMDNDLIYRSTLRASWAMLYAHYEGFTKFCWELLLDQIEKEKIVIRDLDCTFKLLALEKNFRLLRGSLDSMSIWEFYIKVMPTLLDKEAEFPVDCRLETESNLWPNVFERECSKVGVLSSEMQSQRSRIKALVARRNDIAHGKNMIIKSIDEYIEYEKATLLVMHDLAVQVLGVLEEKKYMLNVLTVV